MTGEHVSLLPWLLSLLSWTEASLGRPWIISKPSQNHFFYFDSGHMLGVARSLGELDVSRTVQTGNSGPLFYFILPKLHCHVVYVLLFLSLAKGKHCY